MMTVSLQYDIVLLTGYVTQSYNSMLQISTKTHTLSNTLWYWNTLEHQVLDLFRFSFLVADVC